MSAGAIIALVIAIVIVAAIAALAGTMLLRVAALRHRFGPEYQRLAREVGARRARAELADRQRHVARLGLHPLNAEQQARYNGEWKAAQERFVDNPAQAAEVAAALVTAVAADRGYQVGDHAQLLKDLSVHHARRLDGYRRARLATEESVSAATEELRLALLAHRALFRELVGAPIVVVPPQPLAPSGATVAGGTGGAIPIPIAAAPITTQIPATQSKTSKR